MKLYIVHMDRSYKKGEPVVRFWSAASEPWFQLSNFQQIHGDKYKPFGDFAFPSSEHAFQSRLVVEKDRPRFAIGGDLANEKAFELIYGDASYSKRNYWMKKSNIGIVAKMAVNPKYAKKLGLTLLPDFKSTDELWLQILFAKFRLVRFKNLLVSTGDKYILEFMRGAKRESDAGRDVYWGGLIEDGVLYGSNMMGRYLMQIRRNITT